MSLPLVAQDRDGQLVGTLLTVPSGTIATMASRLPGDAPYDLVSMLKYVKIKALAVREDARGAGIGAALLKRCVQIHWQLDYQLLFGEFRDAPRTRPVLRTAGLQGSGSGADARCRDGSGGLPHAAGIEARRSALLPVEIDAAPRHVARARRLSGLLGRLASRCPRRRTAAAQRPS
ncbi:GNAT family N-acetyltransferase [Streptomyces sp. NPDC056948]|uniref:GNAT family N-acetyltransferase n=1 Tax=Streptomyces sp. NPDC056948 TaxID=3345975 RepID=UPI0036399518